MRLRVARKVLWKNFWLNSNHLGTKARALRRWKRSIRLRRRPPFVAVLHIEEVP